MSPLGWRVALRGLGGLYLVLAAWAAAHPVSFSLILANFGPTNEHLVHDFAACSATFGLGLVIADRLPSWRTPALAVTGLWNGFHAVSHLADIRDAQPAFVGPVEAVLLVAVTALFATLTRLSIQQERAAR